MTMIRETRRKKGAVYQVYGQRSNRKVYLGSFANLDDAISCAQTHDALLARTLASVRAIVAETLRYHAALLASDGMEWRQVRKQTRKTRGPGIIWESPE